MRNPMFYIGNVDSIGVYESDCWRSLPPPNNHFGLKRCAVHMNIWSRRANLLQQYIVTELPESQSSSQAAYGLTADQFIAPT
jgi:hypothetical protein